MTRIKSDLPGDVIATVTEPVYDMDSQLPLSIIPQCSRTLSMYNSQISYGQSRAQVVLNRIILPDTSSLILDIWSKPNQPAITPDWRMTPTGIGIWLSPVRR
ncbi:TrbI/VirB10 family protein [Brenneria rubrifaciens]|uniref:TrbI/VirB10 family protein n=1 Tax=Brenneria rubrifaciens TaxID=55213 RepID=UPI003CCC50BA